jgi:hypothetical protein
MPDKLPLPEVVEVTDRPKKKNPFFEKLEALNFGKHKQTSFSPDVKVGDSIPYDPWKGAR